VPFSATAARRCASRAPRWGRSAEPLLANAAAQFGKATAALKLADPPTKRDYEEKTSASMKRFIALKVGAIQPQPASSQRRRAPATHSTLAQQRRAGGDLNPLPRTRTSTAGGR
jgi:hypothetical protein